MPIPTRAETLSDPTCQYAYFDLEPPPGHPGARPATRPKTTSPDAGGATSRRPVSPGRPMPGQVVPGRPVVRIPRPDQVTASIRDMYFQKVKKVLGRIGGCPNAPATYPELRIIREAVERTADDLTIHNHIRDAAIFALHGRIEAVARLEAEENDYPDYPSDKSTAALLERLSSEREIDMGNPPIFTAKQQYQARQKEARRQLRSQQRIEESEAEHKLRMEEMKWNSHFDDEFLLKRSIMEDKRAEAIEARVAGSCGSADPQPVVHGSSRAGGEQGSSPAAGVVQGSSLARSSSDSALSADELQALKDEASRKRFNAQSDRSDAKKLSAQKAKGVVVQELALSLPKGSSSAQSSQQSQQARPSTSLVCVDDGKPKTSAGEASGNLSLVVSGAGCDAPPLLIAAS